MDAEERRLLRESLRKAVESAGPGGLRAAVTDFGWFDLLAEHPAVAVSTLAELQGELLTDATMLDDVVLAAGGVDGPARVVYPALPHDDPTGATGVVAPGAGDRLVVPVRLGDDVVVVTTDHPLPDTASDGLDPDSGWRPVRLDLAPSAAEVVVDAQWPLMRAAGHRALAHELTAIGRRMLAGAVEHVSSREQFGRRIGSFQAVKHALADVRVWQECAELAAGAAWEDGAPESARLAKVLAGRFVRTAAANCQQVLGGMGFTWEHDFHRYLRRALVLEPLLGSAAHLRTALGAGLRAHGVPRLAAL
ncbi:acyl-CoA dehydrogenase family protein [Actinophytocola sp.]|jgi:hypothetical protein|uniref:acyl-CoA dehydrogenase family protein n=1 Tax=Actinophytocola sp. TaxID=1872138 RepID=UPI002ED778B0